MEGGRLAAIDAVELISSGADKLCDFTIALLAPAEMRKKRIMARDGVSEDYALSRICAQKDDAYYSKHCTYTVYNDGTEENLTEQINQLIKENDCHG